MDTRALTAASHRVYCAALHCLCQQRHVCEARFTKSVESCSWASEFICIHSTACLSSEPILITSSSGLLQQCTSSHPLSLEEKRKGLLLVHSCSFGTTRSLAGEDDLHIGLFAVKPGYFLPFYCQSQKKNSGRICVQTQLLHTVFLLWLVWDGGRRGMSLYKRSNAWKDPEACKRWMCALITVMSTHSLFLDYWFRFPAQSNNSHYEGLVHCPALCHILACLKLHTCTDPWQVAMTGCRTAVTRSGRIRTWSCSWERPAELSLLLFHKVTCRKKYFNLHKNPSWLKNIKSLAVLVVNIFKSICSSPVKSLKQCRTECGSCSNSAIWARAPAVKRLSDGKRRAVWAEESDSRDFRLSPGRCNFQNHLQPKHNRWAARELFLKKGVKTSNYAEMHINTSLHRLPCTQTRSCLHIKGVLSYGNARWCMTGNYLLVYEDRRGSACGRKVLRALYFFICIFLL